MGNVSTALVVLNLGVMCMPYVGQPAWWATLTEALGDGITYVFILEMGLKLLGMGWLPYWADKWNQLDGTIVSMPQPYPYPCPYPYPYPYPYLCPKGRRDSEKVREVEGAV